MAMYTAGATIAGRYRVIRSLAGGMGVVYVCQDEYDDELPVALKTFQEEFLSSSDARDRFLREATVWVELGFHPNIVRAFRAFRLEDQSVFLVLQLIPPLPGADDPSLRSLLAPGRPMPVQQALTLALDSIRGMAFATTKVPGLVHRDIKPENILIGPDGSARITDFGLASVRPQVLQNRSSGPRIPFSARRITGGPLGTPLYMSPEQWTSEAVDLRSDIYSLGIVLLQALIGSYPLPTSDLDTLATSHATGAALAFLHHSHLDAELKRLLAAFLHPNPSMRVAQWSSAEHSVSQTYELLLGNPPPEEQAPIDVSRRTTRLKAESFLAVGTSYLDISDFTTAVQYLARAIDAAKNDNYPTLLAAALGNLGTAKAALGDTEDAIPLYAAAIEGYLALGLARNAGMNLANMGNAYFVIADYPKANKFLSEALRIAREAGDLKSVARCLVTLGNMASAKGQLREAIGLIREAVDAATKAGDVPGEATYLTALAVAQESLADIQAAVKSYSAALEKAHAIADRQLEATILAGKGTLLATSGDLSLGISLIEQGLALSERIGDRLGQARASGNLGMVLLKAGSPAKAQELLQDSLTTAKDINARDVLARAHWALGLLYEASSQYHDAVHHQREAVLLYKTLGLPIYGEASRHLLSLRKRLGLL